MRFRTGRLRLINSKQLLPLAIICSLIFGMACSNSECYDNKNSLPLAGFYSSQSTPEKISIDSISIFGYRVPGDSILHDSVSRISQSYLPFRIDEPSTTYIFRYLNSGIPENKSADTITFNYDIVPWFVSSACGVVYDYKITSIETTHNEIDSVICPGGVITNENSENLKIYFKVENAELP